MRHYNLQTIITVLDENYKTKELIDYQDLHELAHLAEQGRSRERLVQKEESEPTKINKILSIRYKLI